MKNPEQKLIFDLDGTLFDTLEDIITAVKGTFAEISLAIPDSEQIRSSIGWGSRQLFLSLLEENGGMVDKSLDIFSRIYLEKIADTTKPYPGVKSVLDGLRPDYSLNILTNKPKRFTIPLIEHFGLSCLFENIITPEDVSDIKKPDIRLCSVGILDEALLFVGDSAVDIKMAHACGIPSVFVTYGYGSIDSIEPSFIIDSFQELPEIIDCLKMD